MISYQGVSLMGIAPHAVVAMAGGVFIFPFFLFSAFAGQLADRYEKSQLIRITKWTELAFMLMAAVGLMLQSFELLMIVLFLMGGQSAIFGPLKYGILPFLVAPLELTRANAFVGGSTFVAILLGTMLGGYAVSVENAFFIVGVLIISFSLLGIVTSRFIPVVESQNQEVRPDIRIIPPIGKLISRAFQDKNLFATILFISWFWFLGASILAIIPPLTKDVLYGDELVGTLFLTLFTLGMGIGAYIAQSLSPHRAERGIVPPSAFVMGLMILLLGFLVKKWPYHPFVLFELTDFLTLPMAWAVIVCVLIICICGGMYIIPMMTYIQEKAPKNEVSQFIATNNIFNSLAMVISAALLIFLYSLGLTVSDVLVVLGVLSLVMSFVIYALYSELAIHMIAKMIVRTFYRVEVKGLENIPHRGPILIAANHISYIDWIFIMAISPRPVRFVIDHAYYYGLPTLPFWLSQARLIPVLPEKNNEKVFLSAMKKIKDSLADEKIVGIFPEGAITRDGRMRKFQSGLGSIAKECEVSILPIAIDGLWGSIYSFEGGRAILKFPKRWRRTIKMTVGQAIAPESYKASEVREWITSHLTHSHVQKTKTI